MPKINRIRIINFAYNDDAREITDEIFRFYDGENALLNLANGGGKSVLVQLMMQPILPDLKMQKRRMADYFKKGTSPAYVILEWKLDNEVRREYLMTGIAIAPRISAADESSRIHYFTFGNYYRQASSFDLESLPFVRKENGRNLLLPFEKARESVKKITSSNREAFYYSREDAPEYRRKLLEFGISQEEWKNIIVRMNNDEGGITELFERCNTSDSILNEWIIKNIEKVHLAGEDEQVGIQDLLQKLAEETMRKEGYIQAKETMERYESSHEQLEEELGVLKEKLEKEEEAQDCFQGMYQALGSLYGKLKEEQSHMEEMIRAQEEKKLRIDQEDASEQWYARQEQLEKIYEAERQAESSRKKAAEQKKENMYLQDCQQAAKLWTKVRELQGAADALRLKIQKDQEGNETSARIQDLAYSLRKTWKRRLEDAEAKETDYDRRQKEQQEVKKKKKQQRDEIDVLMQELYQKKGMLENETKRFLEKEPEILEKIGISLLRNILGNLETEEVRQAEEQLKEAALKTKESYEAGEARKKELDQKEEQLSRQHLEAAKELVLLDAEKDKLQREQEIFDQAVEKCGKILRLYDLDQEMLYDKEALQKAMDEKIGEQAKRISGEQAQERQIQDLLYGLENHRVYLPENLLVYLEKEDISYETGEAYLQNLSEERRIEILEEEPLLAFGVVISTEDRKKAENLSFEGCTLRQIVPIYTYHELKTAKPEGGPLYHYERGPGLLAVHEKAIFESWQREEYLNRKKEQLEECRTRRAHWEQEQARLFQGKSVLESFDYEKGTEEQILQKFHMLREKKEALEQQKTELEGQQKQTKEQLDMLQAELPERKRNWQESLQREEEFRQFLKEDGLYQEARKELERVSDRLEKEQKALQKIKEEQAAAEKEAERLMQMLQEVRTTKDSAARKAAKYEFAKEGTFLEISLQQMEKEYETLVLAQSASLEEKKRQLEEKELQLRENAQELEEIGVPKEDYEEAEYSQEEAQRLKAEGKELEDKIAELHQQVERVKEAKGKAESDLSFAQNRLKEVGLTEPLEREEIHRDYDRRRKEAEKVLKDCQIRQAENGRQLSEAQGLRKRIEDLMEILPGVRKTVELEEDLEKQFAKFRNNLNGSRKQSREEKQRCQKMYQKIKEEFYGKDACISDILDTLLLIPFEKEDLKQETIDLCLEEFVKKKESLKKLLDYYDTQLENIQHTKQQVVDQCMSYAAMLHEEIRTIVQKSRIRLTGKSRPVQMLRIDIPRELDGEARQRMEAYLDTCLGIVIDYRRNAQESDDRKVRNRLTALTSGRELLNQAIGTSKIPVYVYKIDLNEKNSGMKRWEDAMSQNSGGEKFVVFFTLVSILISYIRAANRKYAGEDPMEESKVLIMDNPFARTSSEHLLRAVMDIADTFSIQLICLSDLSQSSITNRFSLIYQLSIRKRMYSDKEVLKIGDMRVNQPGLTENEKLEHMELYETGTQGEIWDLMDKL